MWAAGAHPWANSYCALTVLGGTTVSASPVMNRVGTLTEQPAHCDGCCATATLTSKASIAVALEAVPIVAPPPMECPTTAVPALRLMCAESFSLPSAHASAAHVPPQGPSVREGMRGRNLSWALTVALVAGLLRAPSRAGLARHDGVAPRGHAVQELREPRCDVPRGETVRKADQGLGASTLSEQRPDGVGPVALEAGDRDELLHDAAGRLDGGGGAARRLQRLLVLRGAGQALGRGGSAGGAAHQAAQLGDGGAAGVGLLLLLLGGRGRGGGERGEQQHRQPRWVPLTARRGGC